MARRISEGHEARRRYTGGIISLAKTAVEHRGAIERDLLMYTGHELQDVGRTMSWTAFSSFLTHLDPEAALVREINPEGSAWATTAKTNAILADIFDMLANINSNLIALGTGRPAKRPKPYPRPIKKQPEEERHFGRDPLPPDELRKWFEEKRKNASSSKRNP